MRVLERRNSLVSAAHVIISNLCLYSVLFVQFVSKALMKSAIGIFLLKSAEVIRKLLLTM